MIAWLIAAKDICRPSRRSASATRRSSSSDATADMYDMVALLKDGMGRRADDECERGKLA
jgi:hypothetical protein